MQTGFKKDALGDWIPVSPGAVLDYAESWLDWLNGDTIAGAVWTLSTGLSNQEQSETDSVAKVRISGFIDGTTYEASCMMTTALGLVDTRSFRLVCKKR